MFHFGLTFKFLRRLTYNHVGWLDEPRFSYIDLRVLFLNKPDAACYSITASAVEK